MSGGGVTTALWVDAYRRVCELNGAPVIVARKGAPGAGAVILKINWLGPGATALQRVAHAEGGAWAWMAGPEPRAEAEVDAKLARAADFDPDLWILEIEDRQGRAFLEEPIL